MYLSPLHISLSLWRQVRVYSHSMTSRSRVILFVVISLLFASEVACSHPLPQSDDVHHTSATDRVDRHGQDQLIIPAALEKHRAELSREIPQARAIVERRLGQTVPAMKVYLSADSSAMKSLAERHHGSVPPSWSAGLAFPRQRLVYLPVTAHAALPSLLRHELAHIALGGSSMPLWVNEGVAVAIGEGMSFERLWTLNEAAAAHTLHDFKDLNRRFPKYGRPAQVAYAQAGHFIHDLTQTEGDEAFHHWIDAIIRGQDPQVASLKFFDKPLAVHESQWRAQLNRGPLAWIALFAKSETLWALTIIIFLVLGRRKLKQRWTTQHVQRYRDHTSTPRVVTAPSISVNRRYTSRRGYSGLYSPHSSSHSSPHSATRIPTPTSTSASTFTSADPNSSSHIH